MSNRATNMTIYVYVIVVEKKLSVIQNIFIKVFLLFPNAIFSFTFLFNFGHLLHNIFIQPHQKAMTLSLLSNLRLLLF